MADVHRNYVVMGVSGSGKSLIAAMLAERLNLPFEDADDYHPQPNIDKMAAGIPLDDHDREEWLISLAQLLQNQEHQSGCVLACSALKVRYRHLLESKSAEPPVWIYLKGSYEVIWERMATRAGHYMKKNMLTSQFEALEEPEPGVALQVDITKTPEEIVRGILDQLA